MRFDWKFTCFLFILPFCHHRVSDELTQGPRSSTIMIPRWPSLLYLCHHVALATGHRCGERTDSVLRQPREESSGHGTTICILFCFIADCTMFRSKLCFDTSSIFCSCAILIEQNTTLFGQGASGIHNDQTCFFCDIHNLWWTWSGRVKQGCPPLWNALLTHQSTNPENTYSQEGLADFLFEWRPLLTGEANQVYFLLFQFLCIHCQSYFEMTAGNKIDQWLDWMGRVRVSMQCHFFLQYRNPSSSLIGDQMSWIFVFAFVLKDQNSLILDRKQQNKPKR